MPKLEYFVVSESVSVDQTTNRVSLFNVLEDVRSPEFPVTIPQIVATTAWNREPSDGDIDYQTMLRVYPPGEEAPKEFPLNFKIEHDRLRHFHFISSLTIQQPGELKFEILINGQHAATHTVTIHKAT
jgi:hypothetical protein